MFSRMIGWTVEVSYFAHQLSVFKQSLDSPNNYGHQRRAGLPGISRDQLKEKSREEISDQCYIFSCYFHLFISLVRPHVLPQV